MVGKNKFYWIEGVTKNEVTSSLNDPRWSPLRTRRVRRALVIAYVGVLLAVTTASFVDTQSNVWVSAAGLAGAFLLMIGYLVVRTSVRNLADAPDELLDERQIAVRNEVYLHAYRLSSIPILFAIAFYLLDVASPEFLWISMVMTMAALPSLVMGWNLPGESPEPTQD